MKRILFIICLIFFWAASVNAMIILDDTDVLEAWSDTDAKVDCTIHGLVGSTFTNLYTGTLGDGANTVVYTAGAAISVVSATFTNTDSSAVTVNFKLDPANGGNDKFLMPIISLGAGHSVFFDGQRCTVMDASGRILKGYTDHATSHKSGGTDDLLGAPGATGDVTPAVGEFTAVGIGVAPENPLHISSGNLQLQIEDSTDGKNWIFDVNSGGVFQFVYGGLPIFIIDPTTGAYGSGYTQLSAVEGTSVRVGMRFYYNGNIWLNGDTAIDGTLTVNPDGVNEVFQVNDGSLDSTDGNAGTTGTLTIDSSGNLSHNKDISAATLTSVGLITATGGQIAFPATAVPSADANTLDDYEEGTWEPSLIGNVETDPDPTYTQQNGWYRKIGSLVTVGFGIVINVAGNNTSTIKITNLPFTALAGINYSVGIFRVTAALKANVISFFPEVYPNTTYAFVYGATTAAATQEGMNFETYIQNATAIRGTMTYTQ